MRKQDRIISLIQSLSQGEKKYFVQRSKAGGKDKSYLKLYELLSVKESYNPDELCRQLKKDKAGLANEKKYLEKQLLSALREYHETHPHVATLNRIAEGVLLMERNLDDLAEASLQNSIRLSSASGLLPLEWHSNGLMLTLCGHPFASSPNTAQYHLQQLQQLAEQIKLAADFEMLNNEVFSAYEKRKVDITDKHRSETRKLLNHKLLQQDYDKYLFASYKYSLQSLLHSRIGNTTKNIEANRKLLGLLEAQSKIDTLAYWSAIANLTQSIISGGNKQEYDVWMERLQNRYYKKLPVDAEYINQMLMKHKNIFQSGVLFYQVFKKEIPKEEIRVFAKRLLKNAKKEKQNTPAFHYASTLYKTAACALIAGDADDCIDLLNILLNDHETPVNSTANKCARLLFIMAHIQNRNFTLLPSLVGSSLHYLKKLNEENKTELILLHHFEHAARIHNKISLNKWITVFKQTIKDLEALPESNRLLNMIPLNNWVKNLDLHVAAG